MTKNPIVQWFRNKWDAILWLMFLIFFSYLFTWPLYVHAHVPWTVATLREEGAIQVEAKVIDLADWGPLGCRVLNQYTVARQTFTFWGGGGGGKDKHGRPTCRYRIGQTHTILVSPNDFSVALGHSRLPSSLAVYCFHLIIASFMAITSWCMIGDVLYQAFLPASWARFLRESWSKLRFQPRKPKIE